MYVETFNTASTEHEVKLVHCVKNQAMEGFWLRLLIGVDNKMYNPIGSPVTQCDNLMKIWHFDWLFYTKIILKYSNKL